jgi:uncharacterized protein YndB with AHSA1/START domain
MPKTSFVYVIYINAPPERIWSALLEPEFTRKYWWHENVSDWKAGSRWEHRQVGPEGKVDIVGEVLESDHPRRLVLSWVQPEHEGNAAKTSRVTFDLAALDWPGGPWVQLKVSHTDLEDDAMRESVSFGWPATMSVMKTLVEVAAKKAE